MTMGPKTVKWHTALLLRLILGIFFVTGSMSAWAMHWGNTTTGHPEGSSGPRAAEDVKNTLHNLSTSSLNPNVDTNFLGGTTQVCVFCHTPHGSQSSSIVGGAPLWNRAIASSSYTTYSSPHFDSSAGQPQGVSLACLSCHDGAIALDALINAGGSGGFFAENLSGGTPVSVGQIGGAAASNLIDSSDSTMSEGLRTDSGPNYELIAGGVAPFPNLTPLSNCPP